MDPTISLQKRPQRAFVRPDSALDLGRLISVLPPDVSKKVSLHDLKRVCDNYNTIPCPNCYGGHFRPCQWCGDSGSVLFVPNADLPRCTSVELASESADASFSPKSSPPAASQASNQT